MGSANDEAVGTDALGIVGDDALADDVREAAETDAIRGPASEVLAADPAAVVAVGETALLSLVRERVGVPVLPIDAGPGYGDVEREDAAVAVEALLADEFETVRRTVLSVSVGGERVGPAMADVTLVTTEPAHISEYAVRSRGELVSRFRADGVVVSTPTGSHGYGRNAGGPILEPGTGVVGVVPVAPFAVNVDQWVVSAERPVELTVERDESEVSLSLDDRQVRAVPPHTTVEVVADGGVELVRVPASRAFFDRA
ncbi:ATP-NAD kinase [Halorussus gelatinilyticus]|uniref:ATP-NAD kinase n=1 Tax=Halorussus gelatinilyticus TaxID=2937524 RepID=A0A8U0IFQ2_9EURY|nr:ATP-NAD kinase [Halorussus gelatinilyticus]UPV99505.1 ATP-NAD kinase [Halorussus gelatinilyticus]